MRITTLFLTLLLTAVCIAAQDAPEKEKEQQRWAIMPIIGYNAEMGTILGAFGVHFLPQDEDEIHNSTLDGYLIFTTKDQIELNFYPNLYFGDGAYHFEAHLIPRIWRANYFGLGSTPPDDGELYDMENFEVTATFERFFKTKAFIGAEYRYLWDQIEPEAGGILDTDAIPGYQGGHYAGLGFSAGFDTRDNRNQPFDGWYAKYQLLTYRDVLGSDLEYTTTTADVRRYIPYKDDASFALSSYIRFATGDVPFKELSSPDGVERLRGIENGRYLDNHLMVIQTEFRKNFTKRFGMTFFGELGTVAHESSDLFNSELLSSLGVGFRIALNPEEKFNLRIDLSVVDDTIGFVIFIREAF